VILVTGSTGFVGQAVVDGLLNAAYDIRACSRQYDAISRSGIHSFQTGDLSENIDWHQALQNVNVVIHLAARVHMMSDSVIEPLTEFRKINTIATLNLARQAAEGGVKRFVFLSSIKVNGEETNSESKFKPDDDFIPTDPYAVSKYEAEQGLLAIAKETGMEVVIIRPPLVYGPNVKANFSSMMKWINRGVPLPLGAVHNERSLVALNNLVSFIIHCLEHPKAANEIFLISDGEEVSTTKLLRKVASAFGKQAKLLPIPVKMMSIIAKVIRKKEVADRLFGSLQVDSSKARELLGWKPIITMDEQLKKTVDAYLHEKTI
jgi:UDP-N-acetyl-alpha-D-quinovosamine dehydrogenase